MRRSVCLTLRIFTPEIRHHGPWPQTRQGAKLAFFDRKTRPLTPTALKNKYVRTTSEKKKTTDHPSPCETPSHMQRQLVFSHQAYSAKFERLDAIVAQAAILLFKLGDGGGGGALQCVHVQYASPRWIMDAGLRA